MNEETVGIEGEAEEVAALLAILALGERDARAGKGVLAADFRLQLAAFEPDTHPG